MESKCKIMTSLVRNELSHGTNNVKWEQNYYMRTINSWSQSSPSLIIADILTVDPNHQGYKVEVSQFGQGGVPDN